MRNFLRRIKKGIEQPSKIGAWITYRLSTVLPDKVYLTLLLYFHCGIWMNWKHPKRFNEKLQWLKVYNRKPEYTIMADKVKAKEWVAERIGEEYIIPTLGVWDDPDEIDFDALPDQFVLKCNHNSGVGLCICKGKSKLDIVAVKSELRKGLKQDYYMVGREWPYKNVPRKILAEKFMADESGTDLKDYKFFCFNGEPKVMFIANCRSKGVKFDYFDMNFTHLPFKQGAENYEGIIKKPVCFEKMKMLAAKLSENVPHLRVDFYEIGGRVYFGELTFFDSSGFASFEPDEWDKKLGELIELSNREDI